MCTMFFFFYNEYECVIIIFFDELSLTFNIQRSNFKTFNFVYDFIRPFNEIVFVNVQNNYLTIFRQSITDLW